MKSDENILKLLLGKAKVGPEELQARLPFLLKKNSAKLFEPCYLDAMLRFLGTDKQPLSRERLEEAYVKCMQPLSEKVVEAIAQGGNHVAILIHEPENPINRAIFTEEEADLGQYEFYSTEAWAESFSKNKTLFQPDAIRFMCANPRGFSYMVLSDFGEHILEKCGGDSDSLKYMVSLLQMVASAFCAMISEKISNLYRLQPSFEKTVGTMEINDDFSWTDIKPLSNHMAFKFDPKATENYCVWETEGNFRMVSIDSAIVFVFEECLFVLLLFCGFGEDDKIVCNGISELDLDFKKMEDQGLTIEETLMEEVENVRAQFHFDTGGVVESALRKVVHTLIYMGADNYYAEEVKGKTSREQLLNMGRKKRRKLIKEMRDSQDYIIIGRPRPEGSNRVEHIGPKGTKCPHYRRAYWRRQRYGPGREMIKNILVEESFIHADKVNYPIKKKKYIVKGTNQEYDGVKAARERGEI